MNWLSSIMSEFQIAEHLTCMIIPRELILIFLIYETKF